MLVGRGREEEIEPEGVDQWSPGLREKLLEQRPEVMMQRAEAPGDKTCNPCSMMSGALSKIGSYKL